MNLNFGADNIRITEFGTGRDNQDGRTFVVVPTDDDVKAALSQMLEATWTTLQNNSEEPSLYEPSEKYDGSEHLYVPLSNELAVSIRHLHEAVNLDTDRDALTEPSSTFCYFARFVDGDGQRLTALRRASQFKGVLKSKLMQFRSDALNLVADQIFKLDTDFDLIVDSQNVHILRPSGFEFIGKLQKAVMEAVPKNLQKIEANISFVDFDSIREYASTHPRAARYLASIRTQKLAGIDEEKLKQLCVTTGVTIAQSNGKIAVAQGSELSFLEVLDRRRYELELIPGTSESFRAASRMKIE